MQCILVCWLLTLSIDNSEYMRNADYTPTRYHAFYDCINILVTAKARDNFESNFALMSLTDVSGYLFFDNLRFELLCSSTTEKAKLLNRVHTAPLKGQINLVKGLKTAEDSYSLKTTVTIGVGLHQKRALNKADLMILTPNYSTIDLRVPALKFSLLSSNAIESFESFQLY
ncbi:hypothetical protein RF11_12712 [Thelohanellus kitauei]|uniref:VWFA domain-containing protein n=1 Tax=Thelohanellus kitauei TaxID=669202 RepID=A0A0C2JC00_THEKT|nr:hypothetical protein RF11_12712 [Thelohanellus kitauei]